MFCNFGHVLAYSLKLAEKCTPSRITSVTFCPVVLSILIKYGIILTVRKTLYTKSCSS